MRLIARKTDPPMAALQRSAEAGDVLSQANLAMIHENRRRFAAGLAPGNRTASFHEQEALRWWRRAASQGSAKAQASLALRYQTGDGVGQDPVVALMWYILCEPRLHGDEADRALKGPVIDCGTAG